ncbi:carotenoid 9,10(9',10')-cleavage dioxygenase 1-like [Oryza brachyantha]|uniref:Uncharacterized protein n=1 Tax=Oryza brachyantha TaxID=4533 RepID=J3MWH6_ORYBR|nr:carotenoid 9,10(9',10')-cleavage dioxygenase 1-like [Oryza brachyantha]
MMRVSLHPCICKASPSFRPASSQGARNQPTSTTTNRKKPFFQEIRRRLSFRIDEASKALEMAKQGLMEALVDSTFKFSDQPMLPSESNFAPVSEISEAIEILQVEGEIPEDFPEGIYIRNGSNPLFGALHSTVSIFGKSSEIWVEGEGMLHALYFRKNSSATWLMSYANRYVQSETFKIEKAQKKPSFLPAIMGDSSAIIAGYILNYMRFGKVNKDISNTNVFEHAGRVFAVAENHLPQEICIQNLETEDSWDINGEWDQPFTAHPKVAPGSGELVIFGSDTKRPFLMVGVVSADGTQLKHKVDLKLDRCTLCHDIGVTVKYNIIMDLPLTIDINRLIRGDQLIKFEKDSYARIGVMPRYGNAESVIWFDVEPFCMFHFINCFEEGDEVVIRGLRAADSIIPGPKISLNKNDLPSDPSGDDVSVKQGINEEFFSRLYQWRLNMKTKALSGEYLTGTEFSMEFPVINNHKMGLHHSYAYAQVVDSLTSCYGVNDKVILKYGGLAKLYLEERDNVTTETSKDLIKAEYHWLGKDEFCSGAVFVPRVGGTHEDDGWIISFVHNEGSNTSQVHIIDAQRFEGAPVAKIILPRRVPYGFHGTFITNKLNEVM